jgi:hypothetical protein
MEIFFITCIVAFGVDPIFIKQKNDCEVVATTRPIKDLSLSQ